MDRASVACKLEAQGATAVAQAGKWSEHNEWQEAPKSVRIVDVFLCLVHGMQSARSLIDVRSYL